MQSGTRSMKGFIGFVLFIIFYSSIVAPIAAQTITLPASDSAQISTAPAEIHYELPYPGILPDHPLYFLKVARDRLVGFLISDPIKKAEFNLLQSDKKLFAAQMLFADEKDELALETLSKSNNYMHNAISDAQRVENMGRDIGALKSKIKVSLAKHEESIQILQDANNSVEKKIANELKRLQEIQDFYFVVFPQNDE